MIQASDAKRFRFDRVELDIASHSLRVEGRPCACSRKAFDLLRELCVKPLQIRTRQELIDALWPGGQVISDEALTQVIFRARAVLGPQARHIVTVRGVGLKLAAPVEYLEPDGTQTGQLGALEASNDTAIEADPADRTVAEQDAPDRVASESQPAPTQAEPVSRGAKPWFLGVVALMSLLATALLVMREPAPETPANPLIEPGYGLLANDLHASQPETARIIQEAFLNDAQGERARGVALLTAVHQSDDQTPVPALFLALWSAGVGNKPQAESWLEQAVSRVEATHDVYLNVLMAYVRSEIHGPDQEVIRHAGAVLDLRPDAWRMHSARAHLMSAIGLREAALREIQQIEVRALDDRKLSLVIADRASLGDVAGAQAQLDALPEGEKAGPEFAFLSGRVDWSRGDFDAAYAHFGQAAERALAKARVDMEHRALTYLAAIDVMNGADTEAIEKLERARSRLTEGQHLISEMDISLMLAELHTVAHQEPAAARELTRARIAAANATSAFLAQVVGLAGMRLRPEETGPEKPEASEDLDALWRARLAYNAGDLETARSALIDAQRRGVHQTRFTDEARWLEWKLGLPVHDEAAMDPPYPPISRAVLRRELRRGLPSDEKPAAPPRP